jgi:hypothetical protein
MPDPYREINLSQLFAGMSAHSKETEPEGSRVQEDGEEEEEEQEQEQEYEDEEEKEEEHEDEDDDDEAEEETGEGILFFGRRVFVRGGCLEYPIRAEDPKSHVMRGWVPGLNGLEWMFGGIAKSACIISFELESRLTRIESSAFSRSSLQSIIIPRNVQILCSWCFSDCRSLSSISFESESRLTRIESSAFSESSLQSIMIPQNVQILCSECFSSCSSL